MRLEVRSTLAALFLTIAVATQAQAEKQILIEYLASTKSNVIGGVSVDGDYVYATTSTGLLILKKSGDTAISFVKEVGFLPGGWGLVTVFHNRGALVSNRWLLALDFTDPENPVSGGIVAMPVDTDGGPVYLNALQPIPRCTSVTFSYMARYTTGMEQVSFADYASPQVVMRSPGAYVTGLATGDAFGAVFREEYPDASGVDFLDYTHSRSPSGAGGVYTGDPADFAQAGDIAGNLAYLYFQNYFGDQPEIRVFRIDSSYSPPLLETNPVSDSLGYVRALRVENDRLYTFAEQGKVNTLAIIDSTILWDLGSAFLGGALRDINGTMFYIVSGGSLLRMVDWSLPTTPIAVDSFSNSGPGSYFVSTRGHLAYVSTASRGIQVIDASDAMHPQRIDSIPLSGTVGSTIVVGHYLYVAKGDSSIDIADLDLPSGAATVNSFRPASLARRFLLRGTSLYIAVGDSGLQILDVADPANPSALNTIHLPGSTNDLGLDGSLGCAVGASPFLKVIDFTDPLSPQLVGQFSRSYEAGHVLVVDSVAYITAYFAGVSVVDMHTPAIPSLIATPLDQGPEMSGFIGLADEFALVTVNSEIRALDITIPSNVKWVGIHPTPGSVQHFAVNSPYIYVADGDAFSVLQYSISTDVNGEPALLPKAFTLDQNRPNPLNAGTEISYTLSAPSRAELAVYNLLGMKVARLVSEPQAAGFHRVVWDGRTSEGLEAPSGVYFYRLSVGGQIETRKMLLLR